MGENDKMRLSSNCETSVSQLEDNRILSFSSNSWCRLRNILGGLLLCLLDLVLACRVLGGSFLLLLSSSYCLLSLSFANLGLLVSLGHNVLKCSSNNGPLELLSPLVPFLLDILFKSPC